MINIPDSTYKAIFDTVNDGVAYLDADTGSIVDANSSFCALFGQTLEELRNLTIGDLISGISPYTRTNAMKLVSKAVAGESQRSEWQVKDTNGRLFFVDMCLHQAAILGRPRVVAIIHDITEGKSAELGVRESAVQLNAILDGSPIPQFVIGSDHRIIYWNKALEKYSGVRAEDVRGTNQQWKAFYRSERPCLADFLVDDKEGELSKWYGGRFQRSRLVRDAYEAVDFFPAMGEKGTWLFFTAKVIRGAQGEITGAVETLEDITERKRTEEILRGSEERFQLLDAERKRIESALRESEEKFRVLAESSSAAIILYQGESLVYVNTTAERMTGYTNAEFLKMRFWEWVHPDYRDLVRRHGLPRQLLEPAPASFEFKYVTKAGEDRWALISAGFLEYRGMQAGIATIFDITERKQIEEALRESEKQFRQLVEHSPIAMLVMGTNQNTLMVNRSFTALFGYTVDEIPDVGKWWLLTCPDEECKLAYRTELATEINQAIESRREIKPSEARVSCKDGSVRNIIFYMSPVGIRNLLTFVDITERKRAEEALEDAKAQVELYLDLMSHDINNLNQVGIGFLELALGTLDVEGENKSLLSKPLEALESSSKIIDNVKKLQHVTKRELRYYPVDLGQVLSKLIPKFSAAPDRDITVTYTGCECAVIANDLLSDLFSNILGNAIKHSSGPLIIDVSLRKVCEGGKDYCRVTIEDTGPGIHDDLKCKLFTKIPRGSKEGGRSLGLYLVKTLVEDYHGKVWAEDRVPGDYRKGCRFVILLPTVEL